MWYILPDSNKQYPVTIERVKKIKSQNLQGVIPEELEVVDLAASKTTEVEHEFVDVVGHISLRSLEKADKKRKQRGQQHNQQRNQQRQQPNQPNQQKGQQQNKQNPQRPPRQKDK